MVILDKEAGETPLKCLERFRAHKMAENSRKDAEKWANMPMTYAGRLDPLASGKLLILWGEECKEKEKYLGLDKEYEVEVLFGARTDTGDLLGLVEGINANENKDLANVDVDWQKYVGKFKQEYPAYSSKTVNGKQLHNLARTGELPDEMPTKSVEIYSIVELKKRKMSGAEIAAQAVDVISKVHGDFRQVKIIEGWKAFAKQYGEMQFLMHKIRVNCSSGTYMRSLAERVGNDLGTGALAFSIHRTKILSVSIV